MMEPNHQWPRRHYSKKMWWKIEKDRNDFPWGGSIVDKLSWVVYVSVEWVLKLFGKRGIH